MIFHNSMRNYTEALLSTFNDLKIYYANSDKTEVLERDIPIRFSTREKGTLFTEHETSQLLSGNTNVLPRASLSFTALQKADNRSTNKYSKYNFQNSGDSDASFNYTPVAYEFLYDLTIQCRGYNEASMIIEQIVPRFNPNYTVRINEIQGASEATSVPISLMDISIEPETYEELSTNIITMNFGLSLKGNIYPQPKTQPKIKDFKMFLNTRYGDEFVRMSMTEWDVQDGEVQTPYIKHLTFTDTVVPQIHDIKLQDNHIIIVYSDDYNRESELNFDVEIQDGPGVLQSTGIKSVYGYTPGNAPSTIKVQIQDVHGNISDVFTKVI